jgi:hypothetical protein
VVDEGRIALDGPAREVLADPRLEAWGVEAPSRIRLAKALTARGLDPAVLAGSEVVA